MMSFRHVRAAMGGAAAAGFLLSAFLSSRILDAQPQGTPAVPPPGLLVEMSRRPASGLGFRNLLADVVWLEAVQVAGNRRIPRSGYDRLFVLLNAVADFDPRFDVPYILGGLVLGESPVHTGEAIRILERGRQAFPGDWRFRFYIGYTRYFSSGDPVAGGLSMAEAARLPGSPPYLAPLATRMLSEGRDPGTALAFLDEMMRQETDATRRAILARRLGEVAVERDIQALERAVGAFRSRAGRSPGSLQDLVTAGLVPGIPVEPHGGRYLLLPDGTVRSDRVPGRLRVFRK